MESINSKTIVTACDRRFVWGTFLLLLSLRRHGVTLPVHVMAHNLCAVDRAMLTQVSGVRLFDSPEEDNHRNIVYRKAAAIFTAESEWIVWIDSDCIVTGDITPLIETTGNGLQIRMRPEEEIRYLFKKRYQRGEKRGRLPAAVLDVWRRDVGKRQTPAINTSCNAHCFVVHRSRLDFIRQWDAQIRAVIPDDSTGGVVDDRSFAYFLLDEAVMSSMLAFSDAPPPVRRYRFEDHPECAVVHFGGRPKPWEHWLLRNLRWFDEITALVEWAREQGWSLPGRPWHLQRAFKPLCRVQALCFELHRRVRRNVVQLKKKSYS